MAEAASTHVNPPPLVGVSATGVVHTDQDNFDTLTRFQMVRDAGVFDYIEKTPPPAEIGDYIAARDKTGVPLRAGSFYYTIGRDEPLLQWHLRITKDLGGVLQNMQIRTNKADGTLATDDEVADAFFFAAEHGDRLGVIPSFEVHVNMWSEHFGRVARVAEIVARRGGRFNVTLDHSHVVFKIGNQPEQRIQDMDRDIEAGRLELDPRRPGNVVDQWLAMGIIVHAHARAAAPNNPRNVWAHHPDGSVGRGIQYPFIRPGPGEWHSDWDESQLDVWKIITLKLIRDRLSNPVSRIAHITTEFIPSVDYGGGGRYSMFDNNVACARWIKQMSGTI
jgi:hypothetical protein